MRVPTPRADLGRALAASLLLGCLASAGPASAGAPVDGPGRYYVFRTLDSGQDPTAEQNARCDKHFGVRAPLARIRLNARLYAFRADRLTSRLVGQTANELGPGFICGTASADADPFEAYAFTSLPGVGSSDASGTCALQPVTAQPGSLFLGCRLGLVPDPAQHLAGGLVTSNSIVNPGNTIPGSPTGSVWTAYVVRTPGDRMPSATPPPSGSPPPADVPGADFYVTRAFDNHITDPASSCPGQSATAARTATLRSVQPDLHSSEITPDSEYTTVGAITVCYGQPTTAGGHRATAHVRLGPGSSALGLDASGECRDLPSAAGAEVRQQNCALNVEAVPSAGVRGGVVTSNALVPQGAPAGAANAGVWTISLFGGRVASSPANPRPRVRLRVRKRSSRTVLVRWASVPNRLANRFDVQVLRAHSRGWRALRRATPGRVLRVALRRGVRYRLRVRGRTALGAVGPWQRSKRVRLSRSTRP